MTRRIRLLVTTSDFVGRGSERELANLLAWLPRDRFEISLVVWRNVFEYPCPADVTVTVLEKTRPWHIGRTIRRLSRHIDSARPDLVFSQLNYVNTATGSALVRSSHQPAWIPRFAGNPEVEIRWPVLPWTRYSLRRATRVAGCSDAVAGAISRHLRVPRERTIALDNVADVDEIERASRDVASVVKPSGKRVIVTVGGLVDQKNHPLLIEAVACLNRPDVELWILGKGPNLNREQRLAERLGWGERVRWLGFQSNPHAFVRQADLFVLSSRYEGLPNALLEAMIVGTPVISTDCPYGPADLIERNRTGWLTKVDDLEELVKAMAEALDRPEEAAHRAERARETVRRRFSPEQVVEAYSAAFEEAVRVWNEGSARRGVGG
jgi:glycosyltransferase involved in cell wall biosynthesis